MALWFKKKPQTERVLEYNREKLSRELQNLSGKLYEFRKEMSLAILQEVLQMARNIQILEVNRYSDQEMLIHRGRLQAMDDLISYIETAIAPPEKEGKPRGSVQLVNRRQIQSNVSAF